MSVPSPVELDTAELRKARGAFFTPEPVARYITDWAVRDQADRVLEPSCGEAAFLLAAATRVVALGGRSGLASAALDGVELHEASAASARSLLEGVGATPSITAGDFFLMEPTSSYDAVIGNPPYVRYQDFSGEARARSRAAALRAGVPLTGLASSWAAFTVHAALFLRRGGRLGLVLPAELLSVNYASEVRRFLLGRFAKVDLVLFTERVFPGVLEEVVLLLADGYDDGPTDHARVYEVQNAEDLTTVETGRLWRPREAGDKWTPGLLPSEALRSYAGLLRSDAFVPLETWGDTTLGMVTGNNRYFSLSPARVNELGLTPDDVIRLSPPGSRHLRGLSLTDAALERLGEDGAATWLFRPGGQPSRAAWSYIEAGKTAGVPEAYKCRVRTPWWRVPLVKPADLFLTYMNADTPRLTTNRAKAHHLNSVHGVYLKAAYRQLGMSTLPLGSLSSMTLVGAETVGRAYGGGMLKLEPREADHLPVPSPALLAAAEVDLRAVRAQVLSALGRGDLAGAARLVDRVLLRQHLRLPDGEIEALHDAQASLRARREARGANPRGEA